MSSSQSTAQRRQMMQPWPLCLMPFSKSKERPILPNYYTRVPLIGVSSTSSSLVSDCASNATIATTASPFNSQQALISEKKGDSRSSTSSSKNSASQNQESNHRHHYYAENLRHTQQNNLPKSQMYNPLRKDQDLADYKQLSPLVLTKDSNLTDEAADNMENQRFLGEDNPSVNGAPGKRPVITQFKREQPRRPPIFIYGTQVLAALSVSLGSMVVGFSCSYTSPALVSMKDNTTATFQVTETSESWIGSIMPLSALFGGIIGGPCIEYLGRRNTILGTAFPFIGAWLLIALASNVGMVLAGRALSGFCVGIASLSLPVYLGETIQPEVRGTLGLLPTALGNIGILLCSAAGMYLNWSNLALLGGCLPVPFLLLMFLIPETPRWYISKGKTKRARKSLQWLRGKNADVSEELTAVEKTHVDSERNASSQNALWELFKINNLKPLAISLGLMFFQQMSGINAVIFYTVQIFESAGSTIDKNLCSIIIGIVNFASTFVATALIDRLGRKILLYISSVAMILNLFVLGGFFYAKTHEFDISSIGFVPLISLVLYVIGFSLGFGPIPWLMMGEILPAKIRGPAASVATAFNWLCTFIVTKTFNDIKYLIGEGGTFWMFGAVCVAGLSFVIFFVPETRGRSLEEIEKRLTGPVRRMSAVANMKPMPTAC